MLWPGGSGGAVVDHKRIPAVSCGTPTSVAYRAPRACGERLIAVILTGSGSDGAAGAREVKAAGGTVVIQNPETASYPSMPKSLAPSTVDVIAHLESIGPLLYDLLTGA